MRPLLSDYAAFQRQRAVLPFVRGDVLDIGCGWTRLPDQLPADSAYVGVDANAQALADAARRYPQHTFLRRDLDAQPLGLAGRRFHTVVMTAVIEHLHSPEIVLRQIRGLLAPEGLLLATTPSDLGDLVHKVGSSIGLFYAESFVQHVKIFSGQALLKLLRDCGFEVLLFQPFLLGINQLAVCRDANP